MLGRRMFQDPVDDAGGVEAGHDREPSVTLEGLKCRISEGRAPSAVWPVITRPRLAGDRCGVIGGLSMGSVVDVTLPVLQSARLCDRASAGRTEPFGGTGANPCQALGPTRANAITRRRWSETEFQLIQGPR